MEPTELFEYLLTKYQQQDLGAPGEEAEPAPLDELDKTLETVSEQLAARAGIEDFVSFARQYLVDNPPQTHVMLAEGFGVQLADGATVALTPSVYEDLGGTMEQSPAFHVTEGRSRRGQGGVQPSSPVPITGTQKDNTLRAPAK